jgi:hypothetical protein
MNQLDVLIEIRDSVEQLSQRVARLASQDSSPHSTPEESYKFLHGWIERLDKTGVSLALWHLVRLRPASLNPKR